MTKDITLNIGERDAAGRIFADFKGDMAQYALLLPVAQATIISDDEKEKAEKTVIGKDAEGRDVIQFNWKPEESEKTIAFNPESIAYLRGKIKARSDAGEITFSDSNLISLDKKLSAE